MISETRVENKSAKKFLNIKIRSQKVILYFYAFLLLT